MSENSNGGMTGGVVMAAAPARYSLWVEEGDVAGSVEYVRADIAAATLGALRALVDGLEGATVVTRQAGALVVLDGWMMPAGMRLIEAARDAIDAAEVQP